MAFMIAWQWTKAATMMEYMIAHKDNSDTVTMGSVWIAITKIESYPTQYIRQRMPAIKMFYYIQKYIFIKSNKLDILSKSVNTKYFNANHEFHEFCHSITFYFMKKKEEIIFW